MPDNSRYTNPIDAFITAKLRPHKLSLAPEADRRTLIRRLTFNLTGLPPAPAKVEAFLKDTDPNAYEKLIDRLLTSPAYGEHWACLLYTSPSPRDRQKSRMPSSA